jgi:DNA-binding MarR family transcriptional regulator
MDNFNEEFENIENQQTAEVTETGENTQQDDTLTSLLQRCGRFVAHSVDSSRGQGSIMKILSKEKEIAQGDLLEKLAVKPGSLSETLQKLEERGFIERKRDEDDKRRTIITLTKKGEEHTEEYKAENKGDIFAALTPEEQESLKALLKKLDDTWAPIMASRRGRIKDLFHDGKHKNHGEGEDDHKGGHGRHGEGEDDHKGGHGKHGEGEDDHKGGHGRRGEGEDDRKGGHGRHGEGEDDRKDWHGKQVDNDHNHEEGHGRHGGDGERRGHREH